MKTAETLSEMRYLMGKRIDLQGKLERAQSAATSTGGIGDGMPRPSNVDPKVERYGIYIAELTTKINNIDQILRLYADDIAPALSRVSDPRDAQVLKMRYIERKPAREIAQDMSYTRESMLRILRNAEALWLS